MNGLTCMDTTFVLRMMKLHYIVESASVCVCVNVLVVFCSHKEWKEYV